VSSLGVNPANVFRTGPRASAWSETPARTTTQPIATGKVRSVRPWVAAALTLVVIVSYGETVSAEPPALATDDPALATDDPAPPTDGPALPMDTAPPMDTAFPTGAALTSSADVDQNNEGPTASDEAAPVSDGPQPPNEVQAPTPSVPDPGSSDALILMSPTFPAPTLGAGWAWVDTVPGTTPTVDERPRRSAFRGSRFDWTHSATTTLLGVGADYQSSAYQVYRQGFTLLLNYFVYDGDTVRLRVLAAPGMDVELTNSEITTTQREPWFRDLPVAFGVSLPLMRDDTRLLSTIVGGNLVAIAPTSKMSRASGYYLTLSPRLNVTQQVPLRGPKATHFNDLELWLQVRYDHLFSRGATPLDSDLRIPRRTAGPSAPGTLSEVLNGAQVAPNGVRIEGSAALNETLLGRPLTFTVSADYTAWMLAGVASTPASAATGEITADPAARTVRHMVGVGVDLTWQVVNAMSVSVGYGNTADLHNAPSNNPLYTPYAAFLAGLVLHVDTVLESLINRDKQRSPLTRRDLAWSPSQTTERF
jgi:hypothetical protein